MTEAALKKYILSYLGKPCTNQEVLFHLSNLPDPTKFLQDLNVDLCRASMSFVKIGDLKEIYDPEQTLNCIYKGQSFVGHKISADIYDKLEKSGACFFDQLLQLPVFDTGGRKTKVYGDFSEEESSLLTTSSITVNHLKRGPVGHLPALHSVRFADGYDPVLCTKPVHFFGWHRAPRESHMRKYVGAYYGIEIEMRFQDRWKKAKFCNFVLESTNSDWFCERDGSLEREGAAGETGVELVSKPSTLSELESNGTFILKKARELGGLGHQAGNFYGLHINCNLPPKNPKETARRFICLVNNPDLRSFWEKLARRKATRFCEFQNVHYDSCLQSEADRHYRSVFVRPEGSNCIEVRIFKSTINENTLLASVEAVDLTMQYSNMDKCNYLDAESFLNWIWSKSSDRLKQYLTLCNLNGMFKQEKVKLTLDFAE